MSKNHHIALTSVLVPTDFSSGAKRAVERAAHLRLSAKGRIHLVHVLPKDLPDRGKLEAEARTRLARAASVIARRAQAAGLKPPSVALTVLTGEPYVEVIRHAREVDADLIVLGCKGAGLRMGSVLGTTAARVVRMSETPILVVRQGARHVYRRPVIGLPLDPSARRLVALVMRVSESDESSLSAVRAYHVPFAGFISPGTDQAPSLHHRQCKEKAAAALATQLASLEAHGFRLKAALRHGDPAAVIVDEAGRQRADLVALGTHARSGLAHALLGSVAEEVIVSAPCDVLIARPVRFTFEAP